MPGIRIQNMGGIAPRISPRLLPLSAAQTSENTKLWSGEITPFRDGLPLIDPMPATPVVTIFHIEGAWLAWQKDVDVVIGFTPDDVLGRLYYTGDGVPKVIQQVIAASEAPTPSSAYPLGVQPPTTKPTVSTTPPGSPSEFRTYIFTWVTAFGEESVPSPPSDLLNVQDGVAVTINFSASLPPPNVVNVRIYRSDGGPYIFVHEVPQFTGSYIDTITDEDLQVNEQLPSQNWYPPDPKMIGLVGSPNGFLAGFWDNKVGFSEAYQPHAWPPEYVKIFDYPVVALGIFGATIVVFTKGPTYLINGMDPRNLSSDKVPDSYPCISKRSVSTGDRGVYYACESGLGFVGSGGVEIVTKELMDEDDWQLWNPETMHGTVFDGYYFGFFRGNRQTSDPNPNGGGFILDINDRASGSYDGALLTTIGFFPTAVFAAPDVRLHFVVPVLTANTLYEWDRGPSFLTYTWRSKQFVFPYEISFGAAKVVVKCDEGRTVQFRLLSGDCSVVLFEKAVMSSTPFRLPMLAKRTDWTVEMVGSGDVQEVHVATSMKALTEE